MFKIINPQNQDIIDIYTKNDPIMGCRIHTLYQCYQNYPDIARFYTNEEGGLLCTLGSSIFLSGRIDGKELRGFADVFGCRSISGASGDWEQSFADCRILRTPVMTYQGSLSPINSSDAVNTNPLRRRVYEILCCDASFAASVEDLHWISDVATRQRLGLTRLYTISDQATAGVYFLSDQVGILASVATLPQARGQGLASTLINFITAELVKESILPAVICGEDSLEKFYNSLGYQTIYSHSHILLQ